MHLALVLVGVALRATLASALLDGACVADKRLRIDNSTAVSVLETFNKDLKQAGCFDEPDDPVANCDDQKELLMRLSKFNGEVDFWYGITGAPDLDALAKWHWRFEVSGSPLDQIRRYIRKNTSSLSELGPPRDYWRGLTPVRLDKGLAAGILCEFAHKMPIVGKHEEPNYSAFSPRQLMRKIRDYFHPTDDQQEEEQEHSREAAYRDMIKRVADCDEDIADAYQEGVVRFLLDGDQDSIAEAYEWTQNAAQFGASESSDKRSNERAYLEPFYAWFRSEIMLALDYEAEGCSGRSLWEMDRGMDTMLVERSFQRGIPVGRIYEQMVRILIRFMRCFHEERHADWLFDDYNENTQTRPRGTTGTPEHVKIRRKYHEQRASAGRSKSNATSSSKRVAFSDVPQVRLYDPSEDRDPNDRPKRRAQDPMVSYGQQSVRGHAGVVGAR